MTTPTEIPEVTEADVRAVLKQQADAMPPVKLPKAGITKALAPGKFGKRQRAALQLARQRRALRARWRRGEFTEQEMSDVRAALENIREMLAESQPEPTFWQRVQKRLKFWEK